jgi:hypothetical protein
VERGLVGADCPHLVGNDAARKLVAEVERRDRAATFELVQAATHAMDFAAEALAQPPGVAVVMAIGHQHVLRCAVLLEPLGAFGRGHRVDQDSLALEVVRVGLTVRVLVLRAPVPQP